MSGIVTFDMQGMDELKNRLRTVASQGLHDNAGYLKNFASLVMEDAKENYVPVDKTWLRDSGHVGDVIQGVGGLQVSLSFGDGPTAPYVIAVHEHLSDWSPPSWQGKTVRFSRGGPKYLERPVMEHARNLPTVAGRIFVHLFTGVVERASF